MPSKFPKFRTILTAGILGAMLSIIFSIVSNITGKTNYLLIPEALIMFIVIILTYVLSAILGLFKKMERILYSTPLSRYLVMDLMGLVVYCIILIITRSDFQIANLARVLIIAFVSILVGERIA